MRISEGLVESAVIVRPAWTTFDEAVAALVEHLVREGRVAPALAAAAVDGIRERERIASTAMVDIGVSIPHARVEGITGTVAALALAPVAVYHVADGLPISIVALVLSSPASGGAHLQFLAALSLLLQSARVREALRQATTAAEVMRLVRDTGGGA
jgi:mannitol/fructose-specific phosphotransferase system IIA component (Ntr-type)